MATTPTDYILCPFRVAIDTREQMPFTFTGFRSDSRDGGKPLIVQTIPTTLATGDYSIEGLESEITIERKSIDDFYGTILGARDRFERELQRMQDMQGACVVADGDGFPCRVHDAYAEVVCEGDWYQFPPSRHGDDEATIKRRRKTVYRSVIAWKQRFPGVRWERLPSRRDAEYYVFRVLERFWRERERRLTEASKGIKSNG